MKDPQTMGCNTKMVIHDLDDERGYPKKQSCTSGATRYLARKFPASVGTLIYVGMSQNWEHKTIGFPENDQ